jgi:hypothetical protein
MFFGSTSFSQSAFSDVGVLGNRAVVVPNGSRINISIGNLGPIPDVLIVPTGTQLNLASSTPSVISWNPIPPGVTQIWVPIDPDA